MKINLETYTHPRESKCFPCILLSVCMCLCMCVCVVWMISYIYYLFLNMNVLVIANIFFQQHRRQLYTWTSPNGQYQNQIDCIPCSRKCRNCIQTVKTRPGADCGSDHRLVIAKFRLKLKKAGKTTRPVRCKLNQISYKYTVEVMNRFRGLDLVRRVSEELWTRSIILYR